ncbi:DNA-binding transcriptional regulator, LysR family [Paraburkholderia steynii]|uniref:DNA-binding transcriptional regulator, LysR family n=1 Tax=Paraburkholderia steynii TaxID=1245441 RepID=A0A7Z7BFM1_9BURK|nr:LysR family transcriptional regulator [Paraburkholderia steynii]SDJ12396.1 DNA-binding transcriptional regulator, LysR family [Paraburkholderia steynii]
MNLQALRYFLMVSTTGSFLATARHFEVPASSVSRFVASLEKELGQQLFYRSTRAVRLTEQGQRYYTQVREAVELLDSAADQLANRGTGIRGLVKINAPEALGRLHIAGLVNELQRQYPDLSVELTLTDAFIDPVQEGTDVTIRVGRLVDSGLIGKVVSAHRYRIAASPEYLAGRGIPQTPADLMQHNCLLYKGQQGSQRWYFRRSSKENFESLDVSGSLRSNNAEALVAAALAGRGIVLFPSWLFAPTSFKEGKLVSLLTDWDISASAEELYVQILSPENRLRSHKVREVSDFLVKAIGSPPYWDNV